MQKITAFIFISLLTSATFGQSLYMPRDIKRSFKNETRSPDGRPGKNYWQNRGNYKIHITANPPDRNIKGTEEITYFNNSPDTLKNLNIKLIMNLHRPGAARSYAVDDDYLTSGVKIGSFTINDQAIDRDDKDFRETNNVVALRERLLPHDSVKLRIDWTYELSVQSGREGMIDKTTFFLAYFYPRISVYDDYNGWDLTTFNDGFEFYNDFNDYNLEVTVPKNYIVWATGTLQNPAEVLQSDYVKRLEFSYTNDEVMHVATAADLLKQNITSQKEWNTWKWKSTHITDVTVGLSDHYVWDASSVVVDKSTQRRASMQAAYAGDAKYFPRAVKDGRNSLNYLSTQWPGVPYPFPKMTSFQGFADMEYPMMVNDSDTEDQAFGQFVQDHEIAHTYFPFYMGINESKYAFMDEGWATTFEFLMGIEEFGRTTAETNYKAFRVNQWSKSRSSAGDLSIITPSSELKSGYGINAYGKPSLGYLALKDLLQDDLFRKSLHGFMERWHGKHPIPWDYFNSLNDITGKDLNWFFNNWFFSNNYIDVGIDKVSVTKNGQEVSISNIGGLAIPFDIVITYANAAEEKLHASPETWSKNQKSTVIVLGNKDKKAISSIRIETGIFVDADKKNNNWTAKPIVMQNK